MTPICPHTLTTRSIVFSPWDEITIEVDRPGMNESTEVEISFDGVYAWRFPAEGGKVTITRSEQVTRIIRLNQISFMEVLHNKLR